MTTIDKNIHPLQTRVENGQVRGTIRVVPRPGVPGTVDRRYRSFRQVDIITYLSSWVVSAVASAGGQEAELYIRYVDEMNRITMSVGAVRWEIDYPSSAIEVANDPVAGRLTIEVRRPIFSVNDEVYFIDSETLIHVQKVAS
jgi:hypothetical protein